MWCFNDIEHNMSFTACSALFCTSFDLEDGQCKGEYHGTCRPVQLLIHTLQSVPSPIQFPSGLQQPSTTEIKEKRITKTCALRSEMLSLRFLVPLMGAKCPSLFIFPGAINSSKYCEYSMQLSNLPVIPSS